MVYFRALKASVGSSANPGVDLHRPTSAPAATEAASAAASAAETSPAAAAAAEVSARLLRHQLGQALGHLHGDASLELISARQQVLDLVIVAQFAVESDIWFITIMVVIAET